MKLATSKQMKEIEKYAINLGITAPILMENAAIAVMNELPSAADKYVIFCGSGNNGGDGLAVARQLFIRGKTVTVVASKMPSSREAAANYKIAKKLGIPMYHRVNEKARNAIKDCDIIIDALLGTGAVGTVNGDIAEMIEFINNQNKPVYSIDVPSGINVDNGNVLGRAVRADVTVALGLPKIGHVTGEGTDYVGKVVVDPISIPPGAVEAQNINVYVSTKSFLHQIIKKRSHNTHKGTYGRVLVIGGSRGLSGAACLASEAALRTGSGVVMAAVPKSIADIVEKNVIEAITIPLTDKDGVLCSGSVDSIETTINDSDAIAFGCGLTDAVSIERLLEKTMRQAKCSMVIDADGLNVLARNMGILAKSSVVHVLTPHTKEFSRMTNISVEDIQGERVRLAMEFAQLYNVVLLLKGAGTVIASPKGECFINPTGNAGMATAGSGDILTGIITSLIGQGIEPFEAAIVGAYLHGQAGDSVMEEVGEYSLTASDMLDRLPKAIKEAMGEI